MGDEWVAGWLAVVLLLLTLDGGGGASASAAASAAGARRARVPLPPHAVLLTAQRAAHEPIGFINTRWCTCSADIQLSTVAV